MIEVRDADKGYTAHPCRRSARKGIWTKQYEQGVMNQPPRERKELAVSCAVALAC